MHEIAIAFWGAFFGTVGLMLAGAVAAFLRSLHRVALIAALSALISALYVVVYLGWLPIHDEGVQARLLAHVTALSGAVLTLMLMAMLGLLRQPQAARRAYALLLGTATAALLVGWLLEPLQAVALGFGVAFAYSGLAFVLCARSARRGDRLARLAMVGVVSIVLAVGSMCWIALDREVSWTVHGLAAVSGMVYLSVMAVVLWLRYSYLIELREVVAHGPSYDPITRMRSHAQTGQMVGLEFFRQQGEKRPVGVIVISIGNLYALEKFHGRAALNHGLFVCAGRLRRSLPAGAEAGRLGEDAFLVLVRNCTDTRAIAQLGRTLAERLARPVTLSTSAEPAELEAGRAHWVANVGVGMLAPTPPDLPPSVAVAKARDMSRTAWSYAGRVAWFDHAIGQVTALPASVAK
jgi:GGDEF domain-containing protein